MVAKFYHAKGLAYEAQAGELEDRLMSSLGETEIDENGYPILTTTSEARHVANKSNPRKKQLIDNAPNLDLGRIKLEIFPIVSYAISCYYEALNKDNDFKESRFHAALMLEKIYNFHEALKQLTIMVNLLPDDKTVWIQRGLVYLDLGNYEKANLDFEKAIDIDPTCVAAIFYLAKSKLRGGDIEAAVADFKRSEAI